MERPSPQTMVASHCAGACILLLAANARPILATSNAVISTAGHPSNVSSKGVLLSKGKCQLISYSVATNHYCCKMPRLLDGNGEFLQPRISLVAAARAT